MHIVRHHPAAPLDAFVECFWWSRRDVAQSSREHMLPSGRAQLIFALHDSPLNCAGRTASDVPIVWTRGILHGPQSSYYVSGSKAPGAIVGVAFRPGAAGAVLGVPTSEVSDRHVTLDDLWGSRGRAIQERLRVAERPAAIFSLLERELSARLTRPLLLHPAVAYALARHRAGWSRTRVADVQREVGYSARHFISLFYDAVGLTPNHYYRVRRFTSVLHALAAGQRASLADLASSAGYSDQSHLTREFRQFAGVTPKQYRPRDPGSVHHHSVPPGAGEPLRPLQKNPIRR